MDKCSAESKTGPASSTVAKDGNEANRTVVSAPPVCAEQDRELQLVFTVTNFCVSGAALPLGLLYDKRGTLFMRILIR